MSEARVTGNTLLWIYWQLLTKTSSHKIRISQSVLQYLPKEDQAAPMKGIHRLAFFVLLTVSKVDGLRNGVTCPCWSTKDHVGTCQNLDKGTWTVVVDDSDKKSWELRANDGSGCKMTLILFNEVQDPSHSRRCELDRPEIPFLQEVSKYPTEEEFEVCMNIQTHKNCGKHFAETCARCPMFHLDEDRSQGYRWCHGDCVWDNGECREKRETDVDCGYYRNRQNIDRSGFFRPSCGECDHIRRTPMRLCTGYCHRDGSLCYQASPVYVKKYINRWPHCAENFACPSGKSREEMEAMCNEIEDCTGFSYSDQFGWGCLKACGEAEAAHGYRYGVGGHDYWEKQVH